MAAGTAKNDFSRGPVWKIILAQALPITIAQLVQLAYNVVDRIYIGHLPENSALALTGIGLAFPLTTLIAAFTHMWGNGGAPIFAIARGARDQEKAEKIVGQVVSMLVAWSLILLVFCQVFCKPILFAFGASNDSYVYAEQYLRIYLFGTTFTMFATGMNPFINAQGYPRTGMMTILLGAIMNLILDPIFIFGLHMGVQGAAIATIISQFVSAAWVLSFFLGKKNDYRIRLANMKPDGALLGEIAGLGFADFILYGTNALVQIVCNKMLNIYGGDLYVGVMTVLNSVRDILSMPGSGISSGASPVIGFNYGAKKYSRVKQSIIWMAAMGFAFLTVAWLLVLLFPDLIMGLFTTDPEMFAAGKSALFVYFFGFFFMAFQFTAQSTFKALKCPKRAIFFSLFRKVIIVVPLTIILPNFWGITGILLAEPISNLVGGAASFLTMIFTLYLRLPKQDENQC